MNTRILSDKEMSKLIEKYEREMLDKNLDVEEVIVLDKYGNVLVRKNGTSNDVDLNPNKSKIQNARVILHTHTDEYMATGLDPEDMCALNYFNVDEIRACDKRFWYSMKKTDYSMDIPYKECDKMFRAMRRELENRYYKIGEENNDLDRGIFLMSNAISEKILNKYGYNYSAGERR